jgi:hypothetical protein
LITPVPGVSLAANGRRRKASARIEEGRAIGTIVVVVILVSSGVLGGAICVNNVGCLSSQGDGITVDSRESVTVTTGSP